nr:MerR family transcriptional regulator [uncultured Tolumonas sp.]
MPVTYNIKEFELLSNISAHNLRYFDKIGLLTPHRDSNGYRVYSLPQVAIAEMISILQKAKVPNTSIKKLLNEYNSIDTIDKLKESKINLYHHIQELTAAYEQLSEHISTLEKINVVKQCLDKPFIEDRDAVTVGTISLKTDNIVDFFEMVGEISNNDAWYLTHDYGFILNTKEIKKSGYPLLVMYCTSKAVIKKTPYEIKSGRYMSVYCSGSLENNSKVYDLVKHAKDCGYRLSDEIYIENVSGPAIESDKKDFIIKIMIPIEGC